ncbi:DUF6011 domain-containing protein [Streptomyces sp. NBC_01218]|uniref:DUF6011 domain-containing protein n=1 Tax=unclassified Streptomyces TaxID=2593676 RepID=UPI0023B9CF88|nr:MULTISPECIES: DUF6011 domain-containing protein [unclassified Streptomyces]WEH43069.1 DUF6011 domain-containing protein [Streptomyces sp. AM 2-1-1]WSQ54713.1 DUF6011 domain-containing protein [Streptomyces sp. NBC_01218]
MEIPELFPGALRAPVAGGEDAGREDGPPLPLVRCRLCGRPLTGTGSRRSGLGPTCDAKLHPAPPDTRARRREADQEPLPGL